MTACLTASAQDYESRYFFWEVVELLRKAAFTIVIVVFAGTPTQMILAVLLGVASIAAYGHFQLSLWCPDGCLPVVQGEI